MSSINVNGTRIETNKAVNSVDDRFVRCADGSWFDFVAGQGENLGPGDFIVNGLKIEQGGKAKTSRPIMTKPAAPRVETFSGIRSLVVDSGARVMVIPTTGTETKVTLIGDDNAETKLINKGGVLSISDQGSGGNSVNINNGSIVVQGRGNVFTNGSVVSIGNRSFASGGVTINSSNGSSTAQGANEIEIEVPIGTALDLTAHTQDAVIGNLLSKVDLTTRGTANIACGRVKSVDAVSRGVGSIVIGHVEGDADLCSRGVGNIEIKDGSIDSLEAEVRGVGSIRVGGRVKNADTEVRGVGSINVAECLNTPEKSVRGVGSIRIGRAGGGSW